MDSNSVYSIRAPDLEGGKDILQALLAKAKKGDQAAFGEIYNLHFKKIYQFIYYRVSHKEIAEDLTEEVFLKAYTKLNSIQEPGAFSGWLYQIARNKVIDYYREKKQDIGLDEIENTLTYDSNVIDILNLQQQQILLLEFIKNLGKEQQTVLKLRFFEDLEIPEIAQIMKKNQGAIRVIQHRAIAQLQKLIKEAEKDA